MQPLFYGLRVLLVTVVSFLFVSTGVSNATEPTLTVSGLSDARQVASVEFTMEDLKEMPVATFTTSTIWTTGKKRFTGVLLKDLLTQIDATGEGIRATAANDYTVEIPMSDAVDGGPIIAYMMDDKPLTVRSKGPLWIVYPYDQKPEYQNETIFARSIWQLKSVEIFD